MGRVRLGRRKLEGVMSVTLKVMSFVLMIKDVSIKLAILAL